MIITWICAPLLIIMPAIIGGILHSLAIKRGVLSGLAAPVSEPWFGRHKTWRGFVLMPLTCIVGVYVAMFVERHLPRAYWVGFNHLNIPLAGCALGLAYMLFELPNSFLKRRFGVKEGALADGRVRWLFLFADQVDSVVGCVLVCALFFRVGATVLVATAIVGVVGHMATNFILYLSGIRRRPV